MGEGEHARTASQRAHEREVLDESREEGELAKFALMRQIGRHEAQRLELEEAEDEEEAGRHWRFAHPAGELRLGGGRTTRPRVIACFTLADILQEEDGVDHLSEHDVQKVQLVLAVGIPEEPEGGRYLQYGAGPRDQEAQDGAARHTHTRET